ncbi:MAG: alpha/beta hydrolase-fold protein [Microscillaceae bacterium]|nr:alpha/beta hydrolase-fold protein [Microscillaceae bacterium]
MQLLKTLLVWGLSVSGVFAQLPQPSSGSLQRFENFASQYVAPRHIDVWLPTNYTPNKKYAVLYMHDGQMLYDSATTWNKQEWGVDEALTQLSQNQKIKDCIVVGVWNGGKLRHSEYFPQKPFESLPASVQDSLLALNRNANQALFGAKVQSDQYLKFLVKELKPFIDKKFSTFPDAAHTFVAGSSMGGLISMYAICEYPKIFGGAACLSTHWTGVFRAENNPIPQAFMDYMQKKLPNPRRHKIYFDYGTATLDALYKPFQVKVDAIMQNKGYNAQNWLTREFVGEDHSENAWRKRLAIPLEFLLQ